MSESLKPRLRYPVIVEGRYDKSAILGMFSGVVITTEGFGIFNNKEKQALIRKIAKDGVILLTDSDGGGVQIRSFLTGILPADKIFQLYTPEIAGKERRKRKPSRSGKLGVEGVGGEVLRRLLSDFTTDAAPVAERGEITMAHMYANGLVGRENSSRLRDLLAERVGLPRGMSAKAMHTALGLLLSYEEYRAELDSVLAELDAP